MNKSVLFPVNITKSFFVTDKLILRPIECWIVSRLLCRLSVWILSKLNWLRPDTSETIAYSRITFDQTDIIKHCHEQLNGMLRKYNMDNGVIVMGAKDFQEVTKQLISSPFYYQTSFNVNRNNSRQLIGMSVCIVPWIEGVAVIPQEMLPMKEKIIRLDITAVSENELHSEIYRREKLAQTLQPADT